MRYDSFYLDQSGNASGDPAGNGGSFGKNGGLISDGADTGGNGNAIAATIVAV